MNSQIATVLALCEFTAYNELSDYIFIKPKDTEAVSPFSLQSTSSTGKPISPHPTIRGACRLDVGGKGRDGTIATGDFLRAVRGRVASSLKVKC